jgi:hypothetical protein
MTHFTPQQIFANIVWDQKLTTETEVIIAKYIMENIDKLNVLINESIERGETEFEFDDTQFLK